MAAVDPDENSSSFLGRPLGSPRMYGDTPHDQSMQVWARRIKIVCSAQIISSSFLFASSIWYIGFIGWIFILSGYIAVIKESKEIIVLHMILMAANSIKDLIAGVLLASNNSPANSDSSYLHFLAFILFLNCFILSPIDFYCSFYYNMNLKTRFSLSFDR